MITRLSVLLRRSIACSALLAALAAIAVLAPRDAAVASFPAAGTDVVPATGQVSITSRIGTETIVLTGTATIQRQPTHLESGFEVQTAEVTALNLTGDSVTGPVSVGESQTLTSSGELRALQTSGSYPASSFFNVYATITAPASPGGSIVLTNSTPLHMVATAPLNSWPPLSATYTATPSPCVPLIPVFPKTICVTSASFTLSGGVGGIAELANVSAAAGSSRSATWEITLGAAGALALLGAAWAMRRLLR
jgi:hypothetical protein